MRGVFLRSGRTKRDFSTARPVGRIASAQYANRPALPIAVSSTNRDPLWLVGLKSMTYRRR